MKRRRRRDQFRNGRDRLRGSRITPENQLSALVVGDRDRDAVRLAWNPPGDALERRANRVDLGAGDGEREKEDQDDRSRPSQHCEERQHRKIIIGRMPFFFPRRDSRPDP